MTNVRPLRSPDGDRAGRGANSVAAAIAAVPYTSASASEAPRITGTALVKVLGPVEIVGARRPFTRAWSFELVVYLAMHRRGATNDVWASALWPERSVASTTLHSTVSAARRALGPGIEGEDLLQRDHGVLKLSSAVTTDWMDFCELAEAPDPQSWRRALSLVAGRPFEGLHSPDWTVLEGIAASLENAVSALALQVAEHELDLGDPLRAMTAARRGLLASPYDERLYRVLLRSADAQGNPAGVESAMAELVSLLGGRVSAARNAQEDLHPESYVHPSTTQLYRALSRRMAGASGGGQSTH
ncbi:MAG: BTAD domain-containing putative transcriptional regulator [Actinomycetota bacterium]|nr:BTAD domain-containing putative transcriptional regulator [Actinomycetota bacterium]